MTVVPDYEVLALEVRDAVAIVSLDRADKANSMNAVMWRELQDCFEWIDRDPGVRVAILAANGKHFCAGLDLALFGDIVGGGEGERGGNPAG